MKTSVLDYLERGAARTLPEKVALIDGEHCFAFAEVQRLSERCATALCARTDAINQPIAVFLPRGATTVFADLGIVLSGNLYSNIDVKLPSARVRSQLDNIEPALIITSQKLAPTLASLGYPSYRIMLIDEALDGSLEGDPASLRRRREPLIDTDPLCIINTSGSTGAPKSVVLNHRSTIDFMEWCFETLPLTGAERIGSLSPFHFDIYTLELLLCLAKGATLVIIPDSMAAFPAKLVALLQEQAISFLFWVPPVMVNISNQGLLERFDLSQLTTVLFAGDVFPTKHLNRWRRAVPEATFVNLYGPIEATVDCTYFIVDRDLDDDEPVPIGFPCRNTDILVLNESNQRCAPGEQGELCVRGGSLAMGYWNAPEETAGVFVQNPLNPHYPEQIYRTGDIVYTNDRGELVFVGRKDHQIKHMGYRIELGEIEHQALRLDEIVNACVLYNKRQQEITLFYESNGTELTAAFLRQRLAETLPAYMLPRAFHRFEELPRNTNGK